MLLSHADRSRFVVAAAREGAGRVAGRILGTVLHDGTLAAVWRDERDGDRVTVVVTPVVRLTKRATASIEAEGRRLARFLADGAPADARVESV